MQVTKSWCCGFLLCCVVWWQYGEEIMKKKKSIPFLAGSKSILNIIIKRRVASFNDSNYALFYIKYSVGTLRLWIEILTTGIHWAYLFARRYIHSYNIFWIWKRPFQFMYQAHVWCFEDSSIYVRVEGCSWYRKNLLNYIVLKKVEENIVFFTETPHQFCKLIIWMYCECILNYNITTYSK